MRDYELVHLRRFSERRIIDRNTTNINIGTVCSECSENVSKLDFGFSIELSGYFAHDILRAKLIATMSVILATAGFDHRIRFWEAPSGICQRILKYSDSQVNKLEITPDKVRQ